MKDKKNNNRILPLLLSVLAVILVLGFCLSASGASITLKVGFYPLEGFFELDSDNNPSGYGVEYLEKVSEYSGIQFQYVPSETWENLGCMMRSKEIDIMMPVQDTPVHPEQYVYSTDNIMHSFFALMTTKNRDDLYFEDYEKFSDLKIAVDKYTMEDENLEEYITSHGLEKNLKVYGGYDLCLGAVKNGEADALISNVMDMTDELKILDKFGITRNYIIMRRDDSRFAALDKAISKIKVNEPYFDANIYGKFFPQRAFLPFTKEETQLIESKAPLTVAVYSDKKPIVYFDSEKRKFEGIAVDMLRLVGEKTGLTFNFIGIAANENPQSSFDEKSADFCITVDDAQYCGNGIEISISQPLFMSPMDFVGKTGKELSREEHLNIAVSDKTQNIESIIHRSFKDASIIEFTGAEAAFAAVRSGNADLYAGSKFIANYQRLNPANSQLSSMPFINSSQSYSVASGKPNSEMLIS
ncbi:MAG: transporter substrate-binding domain-containing protein, partial [Oscillospiraceae bacterium]